MILAKQDDTDCVSQRRVPAGLETAVLTFRNKMAKMLFFSA